MFGAFSRLGYKPWFALAEFVDNSVQSYLSNREAIERADGSAVPLVVTLTLEDSRIVIHDTAAGIRIDDFSRAFVPAQRPTDSSGLFEFGLGMKAAACWFAKQWSVRTCALGDNVERTIRFNVPEIVANDIEDIPVIDREAIQGHHYTTLVLEDLNQKVKGATVAKIKSHLAGIYRSFLSSGNLKLVVNGDVLIYKPPAILLAPFYKTPTAAAVEWKKTDLKVEVDDTHRVTGWAALRAKGSTTDAGFAVFRRGRVVLGSGESPYRPDRIFRKSNSYTYQRLFGELHVDGFEVSHTKDGLQWDEWEDDILDELKKQLDAEPLKLLTQAEEHRVRGTSHSGDDECFGAAAAEHTADALQQYAGPVVGMQLRGRECTSRSSAPGAARASRLRRRSELWLSTK